MMIRDMYLSLESFILKLGSKVRSCSKSGSPIWMDWHRSHSGPNVKGKLAQSLHKVLSVLFDDQQGQWKQGETSLGTNATGRLVTVMPVPPKRGLSHAFDPGSFEIQFFGIMDRTQAFCKGDLL